MTGVTTLPEIIEDADGKCGVPDVVIVDNKAEDINTDSGDQIGRAALIALCTEA